MIIRNKIKMLRKSHQLSQESLAGLLDVSRQSVSKWEQGLSKPSTDNLLRISEIFKISVEDLLNDDLQITKNYNTFHYFSDIWRRKSVYLPIICLLLLFIVTLLISIYLKYINYDKTRLFILISMSGLFAFIAFISFLSTLLRYVYLDCKLRGIKPFWYVLISISVVGFAFYLLRRDEISNNN